MPVARSLRLVLIAAACAVLAACGAEPLVPTYTITDFITNVTARNGTVIGVVHETEAPAPLNPLCGHCDTEGLGGDILGGLLDNYLGHGR